MVIVTIGMEQRWALPEILEGSFPLKAIEVEFDKKLASCFEFDEALNEIIYDGCESVSQ